MPRKIAGKSPGGPKARPEDQIGLTDNILEDIRTKLSSSSITGYEIRVTRKTKSGGFGFVGRLDSNIDDVEQGILDEWGVGTYRIYWHHLNKKRITEIPPLEVTIGDPQSETLAGKKQNAETTRLEKLKEEIEASRLERELVRAEKELQKTKDDDEGGSMSHNHRVIELEAELEAVREANSQLANQRQEDRVLRFMERMEQRITKMEAPSEAKSASPEMEALRHQVEMLREDKRRAEAEAMRKSFEVQLETIRLQVDNKPAENTGLTSKDLIGLVAPMVPVFQAMVSSRQNNATQLVDAVSKVGGMITNAKPSFDYATLIPVATTLLKDMTKGPDISKMFEVMGGMISPIIEVAAAAGGGGGGDGDDITGMINKVLGVMQKGMELTGKQAAAAPAIDPMQQAYAIEAQRRQRMAAQQAQMIAAQQAAPQLPAPKSDTPKDAVQEPAPRRIRKKKKVREVKKSDDPVVTYARYISGCIQDKDEDFRVAVLSSKDYMHDKDVERLAQYSDPAMLSAYFSSLNGVDPGAFRTSYSKRWIKAFIIEFQDAFSGKPKEVVEEESPKTANPAVTSEPVLVVDMDETEGDQETIVGYPDTSSLKTVEVEGFSMVVERPTQEEVDRREEERLKFLASPEAKSQPIKPKKGRTTSPDPVTA
jgi:hypothetical protein